MNMRIKNWKTFQHFKDRRPPWIKLHREILDQRDINVLSDKSFRTLVNLWLLASEDKLKLGTLPPIADIAHRLRTDESKINKALQELSEFIICDDNSMISPCHQVVPPEGEVEVEKNIIVFDSDHHFGAVWERYPNKDGRKGAKRHFGASVKCEDDLNRINIALDKYIEHLDVETWKKPKNGSTWFNNWEDWVDWKQNKENKPTFADKVARDKQHAQNQGC